MSPSEKFLRFAAECEAMVKLARTRESKETWRGLAARWIRYAALVDHQFQLRTTGWRNDIRNHNGVHHAPAMQRLPPEFAVPRGRWQSLPSRWRVASSIWPSRIVVAPPASLSKGASSISHVSHWPGTLALRNGLSWYENVTPILRFR
jgi:hypothetical protein